MNEFHEQAKHNQEFLDGIISKYPHAFFDWKITVVFYIAIHLLKALGKKRSKNIGSTHYEIFSNFDKTKTTTPIFVIPDDIWTTYKRLYKYPKSSRYDGISDISITHLALQADYSEVVKLKDTYCKYMKEQHLPVI